MDLLYIPRLEIGRVNFEGILPLCQDEALWAFSSNNGPKKAEY